MNPLRKSLFLMILAGCIPAPIPVGRIVIEGKEYPAGYIPKRRRVAARKKVDIPKTLIQKRASTMRASATPRKKDTNGTK